MISEVKPVASSFSLVALFVGFIALAGSVLHIWAGPLSPAPALEDTLADKAVEIRDRVVARLAGSSTRTEAKASTWSLDKKAEIAVAGLGLIALFLAVIGFIRHENSRIVGSAAVVGVAAMAVQLFVLALCAVVGAILLGVILSKLDFVG